MGHEVSDRGAAVFRLIHGRRAAAGTLRDISEGPVARDDPEGRRALPCLRGGARILVGRVCPEQAARCAEAVQGAAHLRGIAPEAPAA